MYLFLSPHFDDAALSCGGLIHQLVASGQRVVVQNVMGGIPTESRVPDTEVVRELHARWKAGDSPVSKRIQEDENAMLSLGATGRRMNVWTDCIYRLSRKGEALYISPDSIFGEVNPNDPAGKLLPTVVLPQDEMIQCLYAPLGVGHHVDHQIVRDWGLQLRKDNPWLALKFYEEYPYSEKDGAVDRAMQFFTSPTPPLNLQPETVTLSEDDVQAKLKAITYYETQFDSFWNSKEAMEMSIRKALIASGNGQPGERFWKYPDH